FFALAQTRLVHGNAIHDRIGTREIYVLENTRRQTRRLRALARAQVAGGVDVDGFARFDIANHAEAKRVERDAFRRDHVLVAGWRFAHAEDCRADAVGIAKADHAVTGNHRHAGVGTATALMHAADRLKNIVCGWHQFAEALQFMREHIQQYFRIRLGI